MNLNKLKKLSGDASIRSFYRKKNYKNSSILVYCKKQKESNLVFRRIGISGISGPINRRKIEDKKTLEAFKMEKELGYFVKDGKYWKHLKTFDPDAISLLDSLWSEAIVK